MPDGIPAFGHFKRRQRDGRVAAHNSLVRIEHLTDDELEDLRSTCEARAKAEKVGEETVKETGEKAQGGRAGGKLR